MIMELIMKYAKNKLIEKLNDLLEQNKQSVGVVCEKIQLWIIKLQVVIEQLKRISSRCSDGHLDDDEVKDSIKEIEQIVREW